MRRIALLGATGSIGGSAADVIARHPERFVAHAIAAQRDVAGLVERCRLLRPRLVGIADASRAHELERALNDAGIAADVIAGPTAAETLARLPEVDTVLAAIVGAAGLPSTLAAAAAGKRVLLANKESIVMAGALLADALARGGGTLIPVDSEHNALFQCLPHDYARDPEHHGVERLILTASGGPFRGLTRERLATVTPEEACAHPKWRMGRKISVDSATLMNKGLEVIEAHWLFGLAPARIEVVVHPQSIVHSLVAYRDGSLLAQLGNPDMRTAIAHALAHPARVAAGVPLLDLIAQGRLDFVAPDRTLFRCLDLAYQALAAGGNAPAILNAANEVAVEAFLNGTIGLLDIATTIDATLQSLPMTPVTRLDEVYEADSNARRYASARVAAQRGDAA
jgi:1-deoxy-D-xylulose-5-phosphate reductoisomerase